MNPASIVENKLTLLVQFGLNVEGCLTGRDIAKSIFDWIQGNTERERVVKENLLENYIHACTEDPDFVSEMVRKYLRGIDKEEMIADIEGIFIDGADTLLDFVNYLNSKEI